MSLHLQGHRFEVYALVLEIPDNVDMVMGIYNVYDIERVMRTKDLCIHFLNRSIPFLPKTDVLLKL